MEAAFRGMLDWLQEYSLHREDADFGEHAPLNSSTRRDVLWVTGDSPVLRANDQGALAPTPGKTSQLV